MKTSFCLLIAVTSLGLIEAMTKEDAKSTLRPLGENCDTEPTEEDIDALLDNAETCPKSSKCFRLCLLKQMDMWDNCQMDPQKFSDLIGMAIDGKEAETVEITTNCNKLIPCEDECETAHNRAMCILAEMKSRKWPLPEFDKD